MALGHGVAQHLLDAAIVAATARSKPFHDVGRQAQGDVHLRVWRRRPAHPFPGLILFRKHFLEWASSGEVGVGQLWHVC